MNVQNLLELNQYNFTRIWLFENFRKFPKISEIENRKSKLQNTENIENFEIEIEISNIPARDLIHKK
jgi:hypothetical protein